MADEYSEEAGVTCEDWNKQNAVFVVLNAVSGFASIAGSSIIIYIILSAGQRRLLYVHCRLLLGMSIVDILNSAALALSFIPAPRDVPCSLGYGTPATCTAQGFFMQLGLAVPGYTAMLSIYYLAIISYSIPEKSIARKYEPFMHAIALLPMLIAAIVGASENLFFSRTGHCWVQESEPCMNEGCRQFTLGDGRWLVIVSAIWSIVMASVIFFCAFSIYYKIRKRAVATRRLMSQPVQGETRIDRMATESFRQAMLYVVGFSLTYMWTGISLFVPAEADGPKIILYVLNALFLPLQGFWNFIIFIRPSFVALREEDEDLSFIGALKQIIFEDKEGEENTQPSRGKALEQISFPVHLPVNVNISAIESGTTLGHKHKGNIPQTNLCPDLRASAPESLDVGAVAPAMPSTNCEESNNIC